jgi:hypothetical protein
MQVADFFIGLTLMNAMPHFILWVWKNPRHSGFGQGNRKHIIWGLTNFVISIGLFSYEYGFSLIFQNGIYASATLIVVVFFFIAHFWRNKYAKTLGEK